MSSRRPQWLVERDLEVSSPDASGPEEGEQQAFSTGHDPGVFAKHRTETQNIAPAQIQPCFERPYQPSGPLPSPTMTMVRRKTIGRKPA